MENFVENVPTGQALPWYTVWTEVVTHPSRDTFRRILADPTARPNRAFIWMAVLGLIFGILQAVVYQVARISLFGTTQTMSPAVFFLCLVILTPVFSVIGLALSTAILHGIAKLLGGTGTFNALVYCLGAVQAPLSIVSYLISLAASLLTGGGRTGSLAGLCILPFSLAAGIYAIVLQVLAIDEVEKIGTGKAVLTVLIPVIIVLILAGCFAALVGIVAYRQFNQ